MDEDKNISFGEYLKDVRGETSLRELERKTGISSSHLSKIERGERSVPKQDALKKLAYALNVNYFEMLERAGIIEDEPIIVGKDDIKYFKLMQDLKAQGISADTLAQLAKASKIADKRESEE